jgi:predicted ArsR family transcriptional regulator
MMRPFLISDRRQITALASSVRQDIVDILAAIGPATAPEIARSLGRRPDGLYFHLRLLSRVGLLREGRRANGAGRMVATYDVPGRPLRIRYDLSDRGGARAISRVTASMLRTANRGFARAASKGAARVTGPRRELWAARTRGWLTETELNEVNEAFARLIDLFNSRPGPENACPYEVTLVLSPAQSA